MNRPAATQAVDPDRRSTAAGGRSVTADDAVVYRLALELSDLPEDLRLRNIEWGVLLAITGEHTAAQIAEAFGFDDEQRRAVFARLAENGLVEECPLSYSEYLRARATAGGDEPRSLASFLRAGVALPAPPSTAQPAPDSRQPVADLRETAEWQTPSREEVGLPGTGLTRPVPTAPQAQQAQVAFTPLQTPRAETGRRLSLKVLMRHILDRSPDLNSGQLDVYRVFIRVDTKLLKRNGIDTLRFEDDRLVDDPELQEAIARSMERTLGLPMPSDVFV